MNRFQEPELPDDLRMVEERLRHGRTQLSPLELDQFKRQVLARSAPRGRPNLIWSRLAAGATALALLAGAGGAVALSGLDSHATTQGGAAQHQYGRHKYCTHHNQAPGRCKGLASGKGRHAYGQKQHQAKKGAGAAHSHIAYGSRKLSHSHRQARRRHRASRRPRRTRGFTG